MYSELFISFAKIGVLTFGGGMAMLPMLQRELVEHKKWVTEDEILDYFAIGQCTPGVIAVNTATFVGRKIKGFWGSIAATAGIIFPSLVIIMIIAAFLQGFSDIPAVIHAFAGIRVCVCVLVINSIRKLLKKTVTDPYSACIYIGVTLCACFLDLSPVLFVLIAAGLGILIKGLEARK